MSHILITSCIILGTSCIIYKPSSIRLKHIQHHILFILCVTPCITTYSLLVSHSVSQPIYCLYHNSLYVFIACITTAISIHCLYHNSLYHSRLYLFIACITTACITAICIYLLLVSQQPVSQPITPAITP